MGGEVVRYRSYGVARQHGRDLDEIQRRVEVAEAWTEAVGQVTRASIRQVLLTAMVAEQAIEAVPSCERYVQALETFGAQVTAEHLARM